MSSAPLDLFQGIQSFPSFYFWMNNPILHHQTILIYGKYDMTFIIYQLLIPQTLPDIIWHIISDYSIPQTIWVQNIASPSNCCLTCVCSAWAWGNNEWFWFCQNDPKSNKARSTLTLSSGACNSSSHQLREYLHHLRWTDTLCALYRRKTGNTRHILKNRGGW